MEDFMIFMHIICAVVAVGTLMGYDQVGSSCKYKNKLLTLSALSVSLSCLSFLALVYLEGVDGYL